MKLEMISVPRSLLETLCQGFLRHLALLSGEHPVYQEYKYAYDQLMDFMHNSSQYQNYLIDNNRNLPDVQEFFDWLAKEQINDLLKNGFLSAG